MRMAPAIAPGFPAGVSAAVTFDTTEQVVEMDWSFFDGLGREFGEAGTGAGGSLRETYDIDFQPTAIARKAGLSATFFVAGYSNLTSHVILESWTFNDLSLAVTIDSQTDAPIVTLTKDLRRDVVLATSALSPLHSIVFHPATDELLLFESASPFAVHTLAANASHPTHLYDATTAGYEFLKDARSALAMMVTGTAPDGGGFVIRLNDYRIWDSVDVARERLDRPREHALMRDVDGDGTFDEVKVGTYEHLVLERLYLNHEELYYTE